MSAPSLPASPDLLVRALSAQDKALLRLFAAREAVVPVRGPRDLSRRLAPDRRIFALLTPSQEPMGFVHVALTRSFPRTLDQILYGPQTHGAPRFATFYGITRVSDKMKGRAAEMLKAVSGELLRQDDALTLATFSPIPGLRGWLEAQLEGRVESPQRCTQTIDAAARMGALGLAGEGFLEALEALTKLYLFGQDSRGLLDPVARFHLGNGAQLRGVMVGADCSWHGLERSYGVMASYQYYPSALLTQAPASSSLEEALERLLSCVGFGAPQGSRAA